MYESMEEIQPVVLKMNNFDIQEKLTPLHFAAISEHIVSDVIFLSKPIFMKCCSAITVVDGDLYLTNSSGCFEHSINIKTNQTNMQFSAISTQQFSVVREETQGVTFE